MLDEINLGPGPFPKAEPGSGTGGEQGQGLCAVHTAIPAGTRVIAAAGDDLLFLGALFLPASHGPIPCTQDKLAAHGAVPSGKVCSAFL